MGLGVVAWQTVTPPRIIGIVLVRNEELTIEKVIRNAAALCDEWILCDHGSDDGTKDILLRLAGELPSAKVHDISHPRESHELLKPIAGTNSWVFGLDGDEVYDPKGLLRMKERLHASEFSSSWMILGNVLHVTSLSNDLRTASGYLSPPSRSMTKLYNFAAIDSWEGDCPERLHGGAPVFRPGYSAGDRRNLQEEVSWQEADFRCLHFCFLPRSSSQSVAARRNIMETYGGGIVKRLFARLPRIRGLTRQSRWKNEKYRRGPEVRIDVQAFGLAPLGRP